MTTLADVRKAFEENPLPEKLSDCILVALEDLERVEADARFGVCMAGWFWHANGKCWVCFAGAVMAGRCGYSSSSLFPSDAPVRERQRLFALDDLRTGRMHSAFRTIGEECPWGIPEYLSVTPHHQDPAAFKSDLRKIAALLKEAGE